MPNPEYRAMKARQLLEDEELIAAFEAIESKAIRDAIAVPAWQWRYGDIRRRRALEKVKIIKELRSELNAVILAGKQSAKPQSGAV